MPLYQGAVGGEKFVQRVSERLGESVLRFHIQATLHNGREPGRAHWLTVSTHATPYLLPSTSQTSDKEEAIPKHRGGAQEVRILPWGQSHLAPQLGLQPMSVPCRGIDAEDR